MGSPTLPDFPSGQKTLPPSGHGSYRRAVSADLPFLKSLFHALRAGELAAVSWSVEQKRAFLDQQFAFQHRHYVTAFPDAAFLVVEEKEQPVGRLYIDMQSPFWHLIEIALVPERRNRGIGTALIAALQHHAAREGAGIGLTVEAGNGAARRFYEKLGFAVTRTGQTHLGMTWSRPSS